MPDWGVYGLLILAAASHAAWNALVKGSADQLLTLAGIRAVGVVFAILLLFYVPLPASAALPYLLGHAAFIYGYYFFLLNSYRVGEFSSVYPIARGLAPLIVLGAATVWGLDRLNPVEAVCTIFISLGVALFAAQRHVSTRAVTYAMGTGLMIAGYSTLGGAGVRQSGSVLGYFAASELLAGLGLIPIALAVRKQEAVRYLVRQWPNVLAAGSLSVVAFSIALWAFSILPLGPATAVRETSVAFAVLFGVLFLGDRFTAAKILALSFVLLGTVLLAFTV